MTPFYIISMHRIIAIFLVAFVSSPASAFKAGLSPCPTEIHAGVPHFNQPAYAWKHDFSGIYDEDSGALGQMEDIHTALTNCPAITVLDVRVVAHESCVEFEEPNCFNFPFELDGSDKYPALEVLSLDGYEFDGCEWPRLVPRQESKLPDDKENGDGLRLMHWKHWFKFGNAYRWLKWRLLPFEQRSKTNFELWLDAMDFSKLHSLTIKEGYSTPGGDGLLKRLPKMLPSLKSLSLSGTWTPWNAKDETTLPARDFLLAIPPETLTDLSWTEAGSFNESVFDRVLKHHGSSLRSLEWRHFDNRHLTARPVLSASHLYHLGTLAPNLEKLTIDMNRNGTWPLESLRAVASSLPKSADLTVYFEMLECDPSCNGMKQFAEPLLNVSEATKMFQFLRENKRGDELATALFRPGDWDPEPGGRYYRTEGVNYPTAWAKCSVFREDGTRKVGEDLCHGEETRMSWEDVLEAKKCEGEFQEKHATSETGAIIHEEL